MIKKTVYVEYEGIPENLVSIVQDSINEEDAWMKKENTETSKNKLKLKKWNLTSDDIWYWYESYYFKIELKKLLAFWNEY